MTIIVSSKNKKAASTKRDMLLQTGRITSHETLLWDLETIEGLTVKVQHLDAEFIGGGQANFLTLALDKPQLGKLAEAVPVYRRALKVLDVPNPIYDEQRSVIEGMEKELEKLRQE